MEVLPTAPSPTTTNLIDMGSGSWDAMMIKNYIYRLQLSGPVLLASDSCGSLLGRFAKVSPCHASF